MVTPQMMSINGHAKCSVTDYEAHNNTALPK